jgi:non-heme chloroperoxidase
VDLRGHGLSGRPKDGYADSRLWADDVHAVIGALHLDHPVLSGWSYGPLVILDYLRHYGEQNVGGLQFIGAVTQLGSDKAAAALTPELLSLLPGLFASGVDESVRALESLLRLCFAQPVTAEEMFRMLGYNLSVSPSVRQAMLSRVLDNEDVMRTLQRPVLITHGALDRVVRPAAAEEHGAAIPHAQVRVMSDAGHAPFWDQPATFNRDLREFADGL